MERKETVSVTAFKKWPFSNEFETECKDGQVVWAKCRTCSLIEKEALIAEGKRHGLKGKTLAGTVSYAEGVTYIHRTNFQRHVGDDKSLHAWAKRKMGRSTTSTAVPSGSTAVPSGSSQKRVDTCLNNASNRHYTILFNTILTMIMEDMALLKIEALVEIQRRNGLSISESKVNNTAAREMVSCLAEVVTNLVSRKKASLFPSVVMAVKLEKHAMRKN